MSEHDEQVRVFDVLRLNEQQYPILRFIYAVPNGGHRHPATAGRLKAEGVKRGVPDICLPIKGGEFYAGCYIEMKHGRNKPTPEQTEFMNMLMGQGYLVKLAYSADEALDAIERYCGIVLRGRGNK